MAYEVVWSNHAKNELKHTLDYLKENWTDKEIVRLFNRLDRVIELLIINPFIFQKSITRTELRRAVVLKYNTLYFKVSGDQIEIISFFSNRQNPKKGRFKNPHKKGPEPPSGA